MNPICRIRNSFLKNEPIGDALRNVTEDDLRTAPPKVLEDLQEKISRIYDPNFDFKWLELYVTLLFKGIDLMDTSVLDCTKTQAFIISIAKAVVTAKDSSNASRETKITEWIIMASLLFIAIVAGALLCFSIISFVKKPSHNP
jgi:hypothetical protein